MYSDNFSWATVFGNTVRVGTALVKYHWDCTGIWQLKLLNHQMLYKKQVETFVYFVDTHYINLLKTVVNQVKSIATLWLRIGKHKQMYCNTAGGGGGVTSGSCMKYHTPSDCDNVQFRFQLWWREVPWQKSHQIILVILKAFPLRSFTSSLLPLCTFPFSLPWKPLDLFLLYLCNIYFCYILSSLHFLSSFSPTIAFAVSENRPSHTPQWTSYVLSPVLKVYSLLCFFYCCCWPENVFM